MDDDNGGEKDCGARGVSQSESLIVWAIVKAAAVACMHDG